MEDTNNIWNSDGTLHGNKNIQAIKEQLWILWPIFTLLESHYNFITLSIDTNTYY